MSERQGRVIFVSSNGAMIVVAHDDGFALVELIGDEGAVAAGDIVAGDWEALGGEPLTTATDMLDTYFQGSWGAADIPIQMARKGG